MVASCAYCKKKRECQKYKLMVRESYMKIRPLAKSVNELRYLFMKKYWIESKVLASKCEEYDPMF